MEILNFYFSLSLYLLLLLLMHHFWEELSYFWKGSSIFSVLDLVNSIVFHYLEASVLKMQHFWPPGWIRLSLL